MKKRIHQKKPSAADRLIALLATKDFIPYHLDLPDKEYDYIKLSIYGAPKSNELFVRVTNGKSVFVEAVSSTLLAPAMADRIWGMDVEDSNAAFTVADRMWKKHKAALIRQK